ncbi:MAG: InlB B-repeat-containing protein, partial [Eubacterium sp.]
VTPEKKHISPNSSFTTLKDSELPSREGYHFVKWSLSPTDTTTTYEAGETVTMPDNNLTFYAVWEKDGYGISATVINDNPDEKDTVTEYFSLEGQVKETEETYVPFSRTVQMGTNSYAGKQMSVEYTAKNSDDSAYNVKYKENFCFRVVMEEYVDTKDMMVYANGAVLLPTKKETRDGKVYYYYKITNAMEAQVINVTGLQYQTYGVELHTDGGALTGAESVDKYTYGKAVTLPTPEKTGYHFIGWYSDEGFTTAKVTQIEADESGDKEFYAKWEANTYSIKFDGTVYDSEGNATADGGVTAERKSTYTQENVVYNRQTDLAANPFYYHTNVADYLAESGKTPSDYQDDKAGEQVIFLGWSTIKGADAPMYLPGMRIFNLCTGEAGDDTITLYAVYKTNNYKLTYHANGGKIERTVS